MKAKSLQKLFEKEIKSMYLVMSPTIKRLSGFWRMIGNQKVRNLREELKI